MSAGEVELMHVPCAHSTDKTLKVFIEGFHELHHDIEKEKLKTLITDWVKKKLESKKVKKFGTLFP